MTLRTLEVSRLAETGHRRRQPVAAPPAGTTVIEGDVRIVDAATGATVAVQLMGSKALATRIARLSHSIVWDDFNSRKSQARLSGIAYASKVFGTVPPVPLRRRFGCSAATLDRERPDLHDRLVEYAQLARDLLAEHVPEAAAATEAAVAKAIAPAWRFAGTPWTSGIINRTAQLPYHRDAGNLPGTWSAMLAARRWCNGGWLHLADVDTYLAVPHGSITIFDGAGVLHGVTPFELTAPSAFRYTAVLYARSAVRPCCQDPADEAARAARAATESAARKAAALAARRVPV